ncbi:MAG TPA: lipid-A-disaccharide synthase [Devosia sp.]|nr:lipid-A-disaccharide synthase [Devosia sp.]
MEPLRVFVIAGEASGDQIGADLIARLKTHTPLEVAGVGGKAMAGQGLRSLFPIADLSVMGVVDVLARLPFLLWRLYQCLRAVLKFDPDIVVLIDSQEFSHLLARRLRKRGFSKPILLYVAPTVWVYKPERAAKIRDLYDEVLAILPFEPSLMSKLGGPDTSFVGHPALPEGSVLNDGREKKYVALLPGSRVGELKRHLKMFGEVAGKIHQNHPELEFFVPTLDYLEGYLGASSAKWGVPVRIVADRVERDALYQQTKIALVVSGTATLELAFSGVPMVVTYVMDAAQARVRRRLDIKHISLPNIILDESLVPELLLEKPDEEALFAEAQKLLNYPQTAQKQIKGFVRMTKKMRSGMADFPRQDPGERVLFHAGQASTK